MFFLNCFSTTSLTYISTCAVYYRNPRVER